MLEPKKVEMDKEMWAHANHFEEVYRFRTFPAYWGWFEKLERSYPRWVYPAIANGLN